MKSDLQKNIFVLHSSL